MARWFTACGFPTDGKSVLFLEGGSAFGTDWEVYLRGIDGSPAIHLGNRCGDGALIRRALGVGDKESVALPIVLNSQRRRAGASAAAALTYFTIVFSSIIVDAVYGQKMYATFSLIRSAVNGLPTLPYRRLRKSSPDFTLCATSPSRIWICFPGGQEW
jgi:hypothetical protein